MKNKTTRRLGNEILLSFPKHDSLKYLRQISNVNSHVSIQYIVYVNQSIRVTILIIFRFVRRQMVPPKKVHVQTTCMKL